MTTSSPLVCFTSFAELGDFGTIVVVTKIDEEAVFSGYEIVSRRANGSYCSIQISLDGANPYPDDETDLPISGYESAWVTHAPISNVDHFVGKTIAKIDHSDPGETAVYGEATNEVRNMLDSLQGGANGELCLATVSIHTTDGEILHLVSYNRHDGYSAREWKVVAHTPNGEYAYSQGL